MPRSMDPVTETQHSIEPRGVVYVVASMITGGTQTHLLQVLRFLDRTEYRPVLFCLRDDGNLLDEARALGVEVYTFGMSGSLRSPRDLAGFWRMVRVLRKIQPALVHGYLLRGNFYGAVAARLVGIRAVVTSKRGLHVPAGAAEKFSVAVSNRLSSVITGNSPAVIEFTREVERTQRHPMEMIPSGIDVDRFEPRRTRSIRAELGIEGRPVLGTAITLRPRKGYAMLFRTYAELRKEFPDLALVVAGVEEHNDETRRLAEELKITDGLYLIGKRSDMPDVMASLDVFVLPSESEGMSNAILEALALQVPVVATDTGGNRLVIGDGIAGYIVDYKDHAAMAERIGSILRDPSLRAQMGRIGRHRVVESYSAAAMVRSIAALYDRILAASGMRT